MSTATLAAIIHGAIAFTVVVAATVLLALHDVDATTGLALYGAGLALVGASTNTLLALKIPPK